MTETKKIYRQVGGKIELGYRTGYELEEIKKLPAKEAKIRAQSRRVRADIKKLELEIKAKEKKLKELAGQCDHEFVSFEPGWVYDFEYCAVCGGNNTLV